MFLWIKQSKRVPTHEPDPSRLSHPAGPHPAGLAHPAPFYLTRPSPIPTKPTYFLEPWTTPISPGTLSPSYPPSNPARPCIQPLQPEVH
jgi:hypothetical protein